MVQGKTSIVVVDDNADVAGALVLLLEGAGYHVESAHSAENAVLLVERLRPECVLLDIGMPGLDGGDLAQCLRHRYGDGILLIALTGLPPQHVRALSTAAVVDHYFEKPVDMSDLLARLPSAHRDGSSAAGA